MALCIDKEEGGIHYVICFLFSKKTFLRCSEFAEIPTLHDGSSILRYQHHVMLVLGQADTLKLQRVSLSRRRDGCWLPREREREDRERERERERVLYCRQSCAFSASRFKGQSRRLRGRTCSD